MRKLAGCLALAVLATLAAGCPQADCEAVADHAIKLRTEAGDKEAAKDSFRDAYIARCQQIEPPLKLEKCVMLVDKAEGLRDCDVAGKPFLLKNP